jgi:hypothetical protein
MPRNRGKGTRERNNARFAAPSDADKEALRQLAINGPPIASAIFSASLIEFELDLFLRKKFSDANDDMWKTLISDTGPLSTLNQKIIAAYVFHAYDKREYHNLQLIRQIRNFFAHPTGIVDFNHPTVVSFMAKFQFLPLDQEQSSLIIEIQKVPEHRDANFIFLCFYYSLVLADAYNKSIAQQVKLLKYQQEAEAQRQINYGQFRHSLLHPEDGNTLASNQLSDLSM